jgi:amidase
VSVAAGFTPLSFGTETIGSIVTPSSRAVVYALKPTVGDVNMDGIMRISSFFDSAGPIAKSPRDLLHVLDVLLHREQKFEYRGGWNGLRVGFADPDVWKLWESFCPSRPGTSEQMVRHLIEISDQTNSQKKQDYLNVIDKIKSLGATVKYPIKLDEPDKFNKTADGKETSGPIACKLTHLISSDLT